MVAGVGLLVAIVSVLPIAGGRGPAAAQDVLSLSVGVVFMLLGGWLALSRGGSKYKHRNGASTLITSVVVIAGGLALMWSILSRAI
jgi:hypothetical protein